MTSRKVALLLAASVFLTGATGAFLGSMTPTYAITGIDELRDVNENHWAYEALRDLVEKYDVIEGYPDNTFRGERAATRWEMAAALNALIKSVGRDLARLGAEKADRADLERLARLQEEFRSELNALQARTDALESRASAIEAKNEEQDQRLTLLERTQLHGDVSLGLLSDIGANGTAVGGNNTSGGILDGISAVGRIRLTMDVPVKDDNPDSHVGRGDVHARLIGAFGRFAPSGGAGDNAGAFSPFSGYSRIASDSSLNNEGVGAGQPSGYGILNGGGNTRLSMYVENVHYKQHFKSGIPLLTDWMMGTSEQDSEWATTGDLYVGIVPWRYLYDKSPYRGNELTQFQNNAFVNTPGIAVNYNMPMVAYAWHQMLGSDNLSLDFTTGVGSINVGDVMDGLNLTYEARLNYQVADLPGSLYFGGYHIWAAGNTLDGNQTLGTLGLSNRGGIPYQPTLGTYNMDNDSTNALYTGWNQEWFKGIGTTISGMLSDGGTTNLLYTSVNQTTGAGGSAGLREGIAVAPQWSIGGVLNLPMSAFGFDRQKDALGIGYGVVKLHQEAAEQVGAPRNVSDELEHVMEVYYRWQVNDSISVVPSYQLIGNRLGVGQNDVSHVIGLRTNFVF